MKIILSLVLFFALLGSVYAARPGSNPGCFGDVPIVVTFTATIPDAAITNDDPAKVYQPGISGTGVTNTEIHGYGTCDGASHDATMYLVRDRKTKVYRSVRMQFPAALDPGLTGPVWFAGGNPFLTAADMRMNIRNLTGYPQVTPGQPSTYYTRMTLQFVHPGGSEIYRLVFNPHDFSCPGLCVPVIHFIPDDPAVVNYPEETSWVKVTYTPGTGTTKDKWEVEGAVTLFDHDGHPDTAAIPTVRAKLLGADGHDYGQYSMPFKLLITLK